MRGAQGSPATVRLPQSSRRNLQKDTESRPVESSTRHFPRNSLKTLQETSVKFADHFTRPAHNLSMILLRDLFLRLTTRHQPLPHAPRGRFGGPKLNRKRNPIYFAHKMALNPFRVNKTTSKPWSNLVKFIRFYAPNRPFSAPKRPQTARIYRDFADQVRSGMGASVVRPLHHRPFFHPQILVQHGGGDLRRIEVKGERALIAEACEEQLAAGC
jgi:hypothetical protein